MPKAVHDARADSREVLKGGPILTRLGWAVDQRGEDSRKAARETLRLRRRAKERWRTLPVRRKAVASSSDDETD